MLGEDYFKTFLKYAASSGVLRGTDGTMYFPMDKVYQYIDQKGTSGSWRVLLDTLTKGIDNYKSSSIPPYEIVTVKSKGDFVRCRLKTDGTLGVLTFRGKDGYSYWVTWPTLIWMVLRSDSNLGFEFQNGVCEAMTHELGIDAKTYPSSL